MSQKSRQKSSHPEAVSLRPLLIAASDLIGSCLLVFWAILLGPLSLLRGTLSAGNLIWYIRILSPKGLLSRLIRASIDWRLGNFDAAVFQMEFLCSRVERYLDLHPKYRHAHTVLEDFYTLLVRAYLHGGHIDDAMMVIIRAKKHLNMDRLPALARLDAKTAHLVRAGIAAGKMLDGGSLTTLYVKTDGISADASQKNSPQTNQPVRKGKDPLIGTLFPERQGAVAYPKENPNKFNLQNNLLIFPATKAGNYEVKSSDPSKSDSIPPESP